ncbi:MAG: MBL fold metallo-hydrolase, partial [Akkermansia sp.]|nr:MBL fold metallo-hydrolase [Akkermansia sp.]
MISFTNLSRYTDIGSNCYMLDMDGVRIILDSGMHPKKDGAAATPEFSLIGGADPDTIFVTHSHLDHIGTLPVLQDKYPAAE